MKTYTIDEIKNWLDGLKIGPTTEVPDYVPLEDIREYNYSIDCIIKKLEDSEDGLDVVTKRIEEYEDSRK